MLIESCSRFFGSAGLGVKVTAIVVGLYFAEVSITFAPCRGPDFEFLTATARL